MSYPVSRSDLDELQRAQTSIGYDVSALESKTETLAEQLRTVEAEQADATERLLEEVSQLGKKVRGDLREVRAVVKALAGRVGWIERQVRAAGDVEPIDLDDVDDLVRALALRAETGRSSQEALLGEATRTDHQRQITIYRNLHKSITTATKAALRHSRQLADAEYDSQQYTKAKFAYRQERHRLIADSSRLSDAEDAAEEAQQALDHDDEQRAEHGPKVMTGEAARSTLDSRLRDRISAALARGALMPAWFAAVLGYQAPAEKTDEWLSTAAEVLAYRITYAVTDPVVALGTAPDYADAGRRTDAGRRAEWHRELDRDLRKLRQWP